MKYCEDITFEAFLEKVELTESQCIENIRYSLKRPTLLLRRSPSEIRINTYYNTNLLKAWRANMDLQFVLDPYDLRCIHSVLHNKGSKRNEQTARNSIKRGKCWQ